MSDKELACLFCLIESIKGAFAFGDSRLICIMVSSTFSIVSTSVQNDLRKSDQNYMSAFLLKDQKKSLAKEKSPAGEKLPEIHAQWRQELQHVLRFLFFRPLRYWQFLLIAIALNFLSAIFHRRVCFQKNILVSDF